MNQPTSTPTPNQPAQLSVPMATPPTIQIQIPAEMIRPPAPTPTVPNDIPPGLPLIAFAIVIKVTMDYLKPNQ